MIATGSSFEPAPLPPGAAGGARLRTRNRPAVTPASAVRILVRAPAAALLALITLYQRLVSPLVPVVTLGTCACRFSPSCSQYAADAVRTHGAVRGALLAIRRLLKCTPLHPGGFDPVPPRRGRPSCHAVVR